MYLSDVSDMCVGSCSTMCSVCVLTLFVCDVYSVVYSVYSVYCVVCVFLCVSICLDDSLAEWLRR